ncbi:hypothetical protein ACF0H5_000228 [Mactra antiquata]
MFICKNCSNSFTDIRECKHHENVCEQQINSSRRNDHACKQCGRSFDRSYNCRRHETKCKGQIRDASKKTLCKKCKTPFSSYHQRKKHEDKCDVGSTRFACKSCELTFSSANQLIEHEQITAHNASGGSSGSTSSPQPLHYPNEEINDKRKVKCGTCRKSFPNRSELYHHRMTVHRQNERTHRLLQPVPWTQRPIWEDEQEGDIAITRFKSLEMIVGENNKKDIMYLNLHEAHLSYIKDFRVYSKKFRCDMCSKLFPSNYKCNIHKQKCETKTKIKLPGGYYSLPKTIFEKLEEYGIIVEQKDRHFPWFITYDFESLLLQETDVVNSQKWHTTHKPVSVSVCSNVEGFESPKFILDDNTDSLLSQMVSYMYEISDKVCRLAQFKWKHVFDQLNKLEEEWDIKQTSMNQQIDNRNDGQSIPDDTGDDHTIDETYGEYDSEEAMESNEYDPPSAEFSNAMRKENVYYSMLKHLQDDNNISVTYNNWLDELSNGNGDHTADSKKDDNVTQTNYSVRNKESVIQLSDSNNDDDNDDGDDDDDDCAILPFRPLVDSSKTSVGDDDEEDDNDDDDNDDYDDNDEDDNVVNDNNDDNDNNVVNDDNDDDNDDDDDDNDDNENENSSPGIPSSAFISIKAPL